MRKLSAHIYDSIVSAEEQLNNSNLQELERVDELKLHCVRLANEMRTTLANHIFKDDQEEIQFFRSNKTWITAKLIFYCEVSRLLRTEPAYCPQDKLKFYNRKRKKIIRFNQQHHEFLQYYKSGLTHHDHYYFLRAQFDPRLVHHHSLWNLEQSISTNRGYLLATLLANEELLIYIDSKLNNPTTVQMSDRVTQSDFKWTGSKIDLVELIYGLFASKSINNGDVEIKELTEKLSTFFNIDIKNQYRTFNELKRRKNKTSYIDEMSNNLKEFIDFSDLYKES